MRSFKIFILALTAAVLTSTAYAQLTTTFAGPAGQIIGGSGGGGGCSNALDFSVACNSQYIPMAL